jgi:hypothetical protein
LSTGCLSLHLSMHPHRIHSELDVKAHAPPH